MQQLESIYPSARICFGLCSLALMAIIIAMIRRGAMKEKYALLWLPLGFGFMVTGVFPELLVRFSTRIQLHYMTVVVLGVIVIFTSILLYFTARLSQLREDVKKLAQEIAMSGNREKPMDARPGSQESRSGEPAPGSGWVPAPHKADKPA
jgi:hypothetical protein